METKRMTNLKMLREATGGESSVMKEVIESFIKQLPTLRKGFRNHLQNKQWQELGNTARMAKASVMTVGLNELAEHLQKLQMKIFKKVGFDSYPSYIEEFETVTTVAEVELTEELFKLRSTN